jgi:hypothetical protein
LRRIYVIEICPKWYGLVAEGLPEGRRCLYVGETGKPVAARFRDHLTGRTDRDDDRDLSGRVFRRMRSDQSGGSLRRGVDASLRFDLFDRIEPVSDQEAASVLEAGVIDELRRQGHCVYPEGAGEVSFDCFRE